GQVLRGLGALEHPPDWFWELADASKMRAGLTNIIEELASGEVKLLDCKIGRLRLKDDYCLLSLSLVLNAGGREQEFLFDGEVFPPGTTPPRVQSPAAFGDPGWTASIPPMRLVLRARGLRAHGGDAALPELSTLLDPVRARALLEEAIRDQSPYTDFRIVSCAPRVARYKRLNRCTIVYDLELARGADPHWPRRVVVKIYHGNKGHVAHRAMHALWNSSFRARGSVAIAEPLSFLPEKRILIQGPVPGSVTIKDLVKQAFRAPAAEKFEELEDYMESAGAGLAGLHGSGVTAHQTLSWEEERSAVEELAGRLSRVQSGIREAVAPLTQRLQLTQSRLRPDGIVPSHGSFRPAQVLVHDGKVGFIDFDGFCRSEPALDIALFCASVRDAGLRAVEPKEDADLSAGLERLDSLCDAFLGAYEALRPVSRERIAVWEALDVLTNVLHCWSKVKPDRLPHRSLLLRRVMRRELWATV
ncbi:MAG TPA: phosphotransferase, partial [Actinomycetota bacterium]|nr:phosphotransferase [Actinomycetota bacterium]